MAEFASGHRARARGEELKKRFPMLQILIYDAQTNAREETRSLNLALPSVCGRPMADQQVKSSDLVEIACRSREFRKHYGVVLGALLYPSSISAARPRSIWWSGLLTAFIGAAAVWLKNR
ncbi:hypothetical protein ACVIGB_003418 [Bradyrhizobium sp. USDA 4341]